MLLQTVVLFNIYIVTVSDQCNTLIEYVCVYIYPTVCSSLLQCNIVCVRLHI